MRESLSVRLPFLHGEKEDYFTDVSKLITCGKKNFLLYK